MTGRTRRPKTLYALVSADGKRWLSFRYDGRPALTNLRRDAATYQTFDAADRTRTAPDIARLHLTVVSVTDAPQLHLFGG